MKKLLLSLIVGVLAAGVVLGVTGVADAYVGVRGYVRRNGTYVQPHYRSNSDSYRWNNWSTRGNTNPFTGRRGYRWSW